MLDFTSKNMRISLDFPEKNLMKCPLCGMGHPMYINGYVRDYHTGQDGLACDRGFSFCNCRNIWYGDWENIDQDKYDEYEKTKTTNDKSRDRKLYVFEKIISKLPNHKKDIKTFLNVGGGSLFLEEFIKEDLGWKTTSVEINKTITDDRFKIINGSIEDKKVLKKLKKHDVIWASHVLEHIKDPISTVKNLKKHLNPGGLLYIVMPDPYYLDLNNPRAWGHWWLHQHHIMWDLESFVEVLIELGYVVKFFQHDPSVLAKEFHVMAAEPTKNEKKFMKLMEGKEFGEVPIGLISPDDQGHDIDNIDKEHREGAEEVKKLINQGKEILPIACNYYGKRLDGFKRYIAFKELGYKKINVVLGREGGCQHNHSWVISSKS